VRDVCIIGAGHNALVAACYLARAGLDVEVFERAAHPGGAAASTEAFPGYTIDRGASLHILLRRTGIVEDLQLARFGLRYVDADPWAFAPFGEQAITFSRDVARTCDSIEAVCGAADADSYQRFAATWSARGDVFAEAFAGPPDALHLSRMLWRLGRLGGRRGGELARELLGPADLVLDEAFDDERLKTALAWLAAQSGPPSHYPATAPTLGWVAGLHNQPPARAIGGSGALIAALTARLLADGGKLRVGDGVRRIFHNDDLRITGLLTDSGEQVAARVVLAGCHIVETLRLLGEERVARRVRVGPGMGMAVRLGTRALPGYPGAPPGAHNGMQLLAGSRAELAAAHGAALSGQLPGRPACLVLSPSALDPGLAPPGRHTVTIWAQWHPYAPRDGDWSAIAEREALKCVRVVEEAAPGFAASVEHVLVQTPRDLERDLGLTGGNLMHVEMTLESMFALRPLPGWSRYRSPYRGLYLTGASTHPGGGVSGASGRSAARAVLADLRRGRWSPTGIRQRLGLD
jgi:phytoene dehydrogenase-like protein